VSAGKHKGKVGVDDFAATRVYIRGEGWVKWSEIKEQVARAYDQWRIRRAMAGKKTWDGAEAAQSHIDECVARKRKLSETGRHPSKKANELAGSVRK
jgi:hypothetical protein